MKKNILETIPGNLGLIVDWMNQTARYPLPSLALASALALMGVLKGHRYMLEDGTRSNIYTIGIAPSGAGKEHCRKAMAALLASVNVGTLMGGEPVSTAGFLTSLIDGNGIRLFPIDEIGHFFGSLNGKNAPGYMAGIIPLLLKLYSSSNGKFIGNEYANRDRKSERQDIDQPCACLYGTTTPERFYSALSTEHATDGLLARMILFEVTEESIPVKVHNASGMLKPPPEIVSYLHEIVKQPSIRSSCDLVEELVVEPQIVAFSPKAKERFVLIQEKSREMMLNEIKKKSGLNSIYARTAETTAKIALIACDSNLITEELLDWAFELAFDRSEFLAQAIIKHLGLNTFENDYKRFLNIVDEAGYRGISQSALCRKTQWCVNGRKRQELIQDALECEDIFDFEDQGANKTRKPKFYCSASNHSMFQTYYGTRMTKPIKKEDE